MFRVAIENKALPADTNIDTFFQQEIKAYLISHGHLDHFGGFVLNTPNDIQGKSVIAMIETINIIENHYLNGQVWPNFGPTGLKVGSHSIETYFTVILVLIRYMII